jgi:hypothetical protein
LMTEGSHQPLVLTEGRTWILKACQWRHRVRQACQSMVSCTQVLLYVLRLWRA